MILKKNFFNAVVKSQFNYCPLVGMFCSRTSNSMINKVYERALRVILADDLSDFESLLQNNKDICSSKISPQNTYKSILTIFLPKHIDVNEV